MNARAWYISLASAFLIALMPREVFAAASLICSGGVPLRGYFYDTVPVCSSVTGIQNIFSGLVCDYQFVLNAILTRVYCGMQYTLFQPLKALIAIFIIIYGLQFMMGYTELSVKEIFTRVLKLTLVFVFAVNSAWGIGIAYNFFMGFADAGIDWALSTVMPALPPGATSGFCQISTLPVPMEIKAFQRMDFLICDAITGPFTEKGSRLSGFMGVMSFIMPPIFLMFVYFALKTIGILIRALLSYLVAISAIAFLIAMGPIFMSLALFRPTYRFFDDWLRFIISFTFQIVLIFAAVALWLVVMRQLGDFFFQLSLIIVPVQQIINPGPAQTPVDTWGLCQYVITMSPRGPVPTCVPGGRILFPSQIPQEAKFLFFVVLNMVSLCVVAYAFDTLLKNIPNLARQLAGPSYTPQIGGGSGMGSVQYPGMGQVSNMFSQMTGGRGQNRP